MTLLDRVWSRRDDVATAIETLAATARANGNVLLAHDEASPEERMHFRALGATASEFPLTLETAKAARQMGEDADPARPMSYAAAATMVLSMPPMPSEPGSARC